MEILAIFNSVRNIVFIINGHFNYAYYCMHIIHMYIHDTFIYYLFIIIHLFIIIYFYYLFIIIRN